MRTKELGNTGVEIPEIGLGTSQYNGGLEPLVRGIEAGATLLDTAERYGTEEVVGEAVRSRRDSVLVATKVSGANVKYDQVIDAANQSLARLGVDCIDLYQVHWQDPNVPIKETMSAMEALVDEGKVKYIGVSNYTADQMKEAQDSLKSNRIVSNQVLYNLADREIEDEVLPYCQENGITVLAFSPLAQGRLASLSFFWRTKAMNALRRIAGELGKTSAQVALNWCISKQNVVPIPKSSQEARVLEFCAASGWNLTPDQVAELDRLFVRY